MVTQALPMAQKQQTARRTGTSVAMPAKRGRPSISSKTVAGRAIGLSQGTPKKAVKRRSSGINGALGNQYPSQCSSHLRSIYA